MGVECVKYVLLCIFLFGAGISDLRERKVKNWWIALWSLAGIGCIGPGFFLPAFALLVPAFLLFAAGAMGAGDGKLMAVIAGYLGFWNGMYAIGTGMAIGALWSLYRLWRSRSLRTRLFYLYAWFRRMFHTKELIQYGNTSEENRKE